MRTNGSWGVYVSIPFCRFKCTYCNFASGVFAATQLDQYVDAVVWEISHWETRPEPGVSGSQSSTSHSSSAGANGKPETGNGQLLRADSVYFGGGTPSMLAASQLARIFTALRSRFDLAPGSEITLEAAPGSLTSEMAAAWAFHNVNRVSLGVQSFIPVELKAVGRPHRAETVASDVETLRTAGIGSINIDLIAGLPWQTAASWDESLRWTARLRPEHVSVYILEIDEDSRLGAEVLAGGRRYAAQSLPGEDDTADFYTHAISRLGELGYRQYEISNFALPGQDSRHNRKYWEGAPYAGFGVDAHSFDGLRRSANTDSLDAYLAAVAARRTPLVVANELDERRRAEERIFLGLRQNQGVELAPSEHERYRDEIDRMTRAGLLEVADGRLRLTSRGRLLSNEVFAEFIE